MEIAQTISSMMNIVTALKRDVGELDSGVVELTTLYSALPVAVPGLVIGAGQYTGNPDLLTDAQIQDITDNVARGNLVLLVLYQDLYKNGSIIARCVGFDGTWFRCVLLSKSEADKTNVFLVKDPRKQVWGWIVYDKLVGA